MLRYFSGFGASRSPSGIGDSYDTWDFGASRSPSGICDSYDTQDFSGDISGYSGWRHRAATLNGSLGDRPTPALSN